MRASSLEEIASKWTLGHTVAVSAWVVVIVLALMLFTRHVSDAYPATDVLQMYAAENATFAYPENWTINTCGSGRPFIELPGTLKADFKGQQAYAFTIYAATSYACMKDRPERLDIYSETLVASDSPCAPATSTKGEKLDNGLYLQIMEEKGAVVGVHIKQNSCFAPSGASVLSFGFTDPKADKGDPLEFGPPRVDKQAFLASRQYQDIHALAQSIRY